MTKKTGLIGILGGLGPEAGRLLHGYIIEQAKSHKKITCDQDHYDVIHLSLSSLIPDRASYIFDQSCPDPTPIIFTILKEMGKISTVYHRKVNVCIPCNTYHAPILFDPLEELLASSPYADTVKILNLVQESSLAVHDLDSSLTQVGLISTSGERASNIYRHYLGQKNIDIIQVNEEKQRLVDEAIYHPIYGLKSTSNGSLEVRKILKDVVRTLYDQGAQVIILGCTELPFVFEETSFESIIFISPMRIMARRLMEEADKG